MLGANINKTKKFMNESLDFLSEFIRLYKCDPEQAQRIWSLWNPLQREIAKIVCENVEDYIFKKDDISFDNFNFNN